ncbi:MAG: hypothetical protein WDM96_13975 [Lacunisphaera sp.]
MNRLSPSGLPAIFATTLLGLCLPAVVRAADWQALLGNSPFGQSASATTAPAAGELEFRGVVQEENVYLVNLYNPSTKTSQWIPVKGRVPGLEVQAYDAGSDKVSITQAGRPLTLTLKQAHVTLLAAAPTPAAAAPNEAPPDGPEERSRDERRAEIREMMRARRENGGAGPFRDLPPEALQRMQELRRRRAEALSGQAAGGAQTTATPAAPTRPPQ